MIQWEIVGFGAGIFGVLVIVGVQIYFTFPRQFEEEFKEKIEKIQIIFNYKISNELQTLFESKFKYREEKANLIKSKVSVFPENNLLGEEIEKMDYLHTKW